MHASGTPHCRDTACRVRGVTVCRVRGVTVCRVRGVTVCRVRGVTVCRVRGATACRGGTEEGRNAEIARVSTASWTDQSTNEAEEGVPRVSGAPSFRFAAGRSVLLTM